MNYMTALSLRWRLLVPLVLCLALALHPPRACAQGDADLIVVCYNVENLLDTIDDPYTTDEEFTPEGAKRWTSHRYRRKLERIATVLGRIGEARWPDLIGLVEVEHAGVLEDLLRLTPLGRQGYRYVLTTSPDERGMDVALLYRSGRISLEASRSYSIPWTDVRKRSRDLLQARLRLPNGEILHTWVVHLPSRRGGVSATEGYRREACRTLRTLCDSVVRHSPHLLVMGDFNGEPHEPATRLDLGASLEAVYTPSSELRLHNLCSRGVLRQHDATSQYGTYCFRGVWSQLDQIIVSGSMLSPESRVRYQAGSVAVYAPPYLRRGAVYAGQRAPWRTYAGHHYVGGYSDHFPVVVRLSLVGHRGTDTLAR